MHYNFWKIRLVLTPPLGDTKRTVILHCKQSVALKLAQLFSNFKDFTVPVSEISLYSKSLHRNVEKLTLLLYSTLRRKYRYVQFVNKSLLVEMKKGIMSSRDIYRTIKMPDGNEPT